jgi:hypothetical protein
MYKLQFSDGPAVMGAGTRAIVLSAADRAALDADFNGWMGLFDAPGAELSALHAECRGRHENPLLATFPYPHARDAEKFTRVANARPTLSDYTGSIESLAATTVGSEVLILRTLQRFGAVWMPATVLATPDRVRLADGRVAPASAKAAALTDREHLGDGKCELAADGAQWRRGKDGKLTRLPRFCGDVSTLGEIAAMGVRDVVLFDGRAWTVAEVA